MKAEIRYLKRKEIEEAKWSECLLNSPNGLCYSTIEFLDAMSPDWSALVMNDYEAIMPLPWRKKYGIKYLYTPAFMQQLGVSMGEINNNLSDWFLSSIPSSFKYWDIQLNASNSTKKYSHTLRKNYFLPLVESEPSLKNKYHRNALRNIKKAQEQGIEVVEDISAALLIQMHRERFGKLNGISDKDYRSFEMLLDKWSGSPKAKLIGAKDKSGHIIASSGYIIFKNRITFIINGNNELSLSTGASHLLKNHIITSHSNSNYVLDFEGSDNPDFARFYQQFGADTCEHYPRIIQNNLPWPINLFKR